MPSITGYVDDEQKERIEQLIEDEDYEDKSEFIHTAVGYYLYHRH